MTWLPVLLIFFIGAIVGSFLNMLIYRLPIDESIWKPRSHCPKVKLIHQFPHL